MNTTLELNAEQQAAVESEAPLRLVIAGAGTGKTRTLVAAVANEAECGTQPSEIIVITYTTAAAAVLVTRLNVFSIGSELGFCGTLHGFLYRLLCEHHELVGLPAQLSVVDDEQKEGLLESIVVEMGIKASAKKALEWLKQDGHPGDDTRAELKEQLVAKEYRDRLRQSGLLDFDLILELGKQLCVRLHNEGKWPYKALYVDELQDASHADWGIYGARACERKYMTGDPDQAIFGFRGGAVGNMVAAADLGSNPKATGNGVFEVHVLSKNYRSAEQVCLAANYLIQHNTGRVDKDMESHGPGGDVTVQRCTDPLEEQICVAKMIREFIAQQCSPYKDTLPSDNYKRVAVLARTNRIADEHAQFLRSQGVPVAQCKWKQEAPDWKETELLLTVLANPWNDMVVWQYITGPIWTRDGSIKLNKEKASEIKIEAAKKMVGLNEHLGFVFGKGDASATSFEVDLSRHGVSAESRERVHDACRRLSAGGKWDLTDLVMFLNGREEERETEGEGVFVGTVHSAKGREWDVVFLVGCEEGLFPQTRKDLDLEEERRLFYVGLTRARERVVLMWCAERPQARRAGSPPGPAELRQVSRFVAEAGL